MLAPMLDLCRLILAIASDLSRSRVALEAEILVRRQKINLLRRANPKRLRGKHLLGMSISQDLCKVLLAHYVGEVNIKSRDLAVWQRYFCFPASPDTTLRFNLSLCPAMRLGLVANYVAAVFICDSQGAPHETIT